jgi:pyruvate kinase
VIRKTESKERSAARARQDQVAIASEGVARLRRSALDLEHEYAAELDGLAPELRRSGVNLLHYLAVRHHDIRELQGVLVQLGMSSLGRMEAHVMATMDAVSELLRESLKPPSCKHLPSSNAISFDEGAKLLTHHADVILGPSVPERETRTMVTMPSEAADDPGLIKTLVANGMDIMRINCAHDSSKEWERMVHHLRNAEKAIGRKCKISFDLAGPKLRTGSIRPGIAVIKWKPTRNELGEVVAPATVTIVAREDMAALANDTVPIQGELPKVVKVGDRISLVDARASKRKLIVVAKTKDGCVCEASETAYVTPGTSLTLHRGRKSLGKMHVADFIAEPESILLEPGDTLALKLSDHAGQDAIRNKTGKVLEPATLTCSLEAVFQGVKPGERIFFDDGKIAGVINKVTPECLDIGILQVVGGSARLRDEKGINLPDSHLLLPAISAKDLEDLAFAVKHADMVAMSFVQRAEDIRQLLAELRHLGKPGLGIVLKIETQQAFADLPALLLEAMKHYPVAVMVARGDLGVEVGFERLAEVQEEILWLCEAAHVPVIWATQVLESLAKGGMPSRAEVTDAAISGRAECVMLNKGPYIEQTLQFLCNVLNRMEAHHQKKTSMLRRLSISQLHRRSKPEKPTRKE